MIQNKTDRRFLSSALLRAWALCAALLGLTLLSAAQGAETATKAAKLKVLCTTFPVYQITKNVASGRNDLEVQLMIAASLGCPHDYAPTPQDMQKLAKADLLIANGLGMEEFLGAPVRSAHSKIRVIDASAGIIQTLTYTDAMHHPEEKTNRAKTTEQEEHLHTGVNPHLFASPRMSALMARNIADALAAADPSAAALYAKNAKDYAGRMNALADEFAALGKVLRNNRIITQHGVFDYLARDMGLKIVAVLQAHAGEDPSAAEMRAIIGEAKEEKAGAVFTEPQYPAKIGQTVAKEAGIPAASLDPAASGPEDAQADYYETVMRNNLKILREVLGVK